MAGAFLFFSLALFVSQAIGASGAAGAVTSLPPLCQSQSQPNPIAAEHSSLVTGTVNGTVAVLPIPLSLARSIIPAQYAILDGYKQLLPDFSADQYPVIIESVLDHDIESHGVNLVPDFSRVAIIYPFVDLLGDGYSNFRYGKYVLISSNPVAVAGVAAYGVIPVPCTFDPPCDGYATVPQRPETVYFNAYQGPDQALNNPPVASLQFTDTNSNGPYSIDFYRNVTNQPLFNNGVLCDNFIALYNTSVSEGPYTPITVIGNVSITAPYFPITTTFEGAYGLKVDRAFIENNFMACSSLKGYTASGPGD